MSFLVVLPCVFPDIEWWGLNADRTSYFYTVDVHLVILFFKNEKRSTYGYGIWYELRR